METSSLWELRPPDPESLELCGMGHTDSLGESPGGVVNKGTPAVTLYSQIHIFYQKTDQGGHNSIKKPLLQGVQWTVKMVPVTGTGTELTSLQSHV